MITGTSSGICRETALKLAERGARLALNARREDALDEGARLCRDRAAECEVFPADVGSPEEVTRGSWWRPSARWTSGSTTPA